MINNNSVLESETCFEQTGDLVGKSNYSTQSFCLRDHVENYDILRNSKTL